ncbi:MAG TPA: ABC transporter substrate-binding protein [Candidatus Limnocylindrales bacterium]|nr:ABC transporter substrate-binding protein [Candidatus Limnocylindrales bacterium]
MIRRLALLVSFALAGGALVACTGGTSPSPSARTPLVVGLGFIPSVQFAPFYLAEQEGYYADAGLDVTFQFKIDPDLVTLVGQGSIDVGSADGTSVIPAVSQGIPIRYVATIYGSFPSIVFATASSGITEAADLKGTKLGIPGRFGSSWIMLQALLGSAGLTPDDLEIVEYPDFGQGAAVAQGAVDAATGFANNEPVQLALSGEEVVVLHVDDTIALPGPGLIAGTATLDAKGDAIRAFVAQTLRAMRDIEADPERGLEAAIAAVPELAEQREAQLAILEATIDVWSGRVTAERGLGAIDRDGWQASVTFMADLGLVPNAVTVDALVTDAYLPAE